MERLLIEPTKSTPAIRFDSAKQVLTISGSCYPEDAVAFFAPVRDLVQTWLHSPSAPMVVDVRLAHLSTSCSRCLLGLLRMIEEARKPTSDVRVVWHYDPENEMALEWGTSFREELKIRFDIVADPEGGVLGT